MSSRRRAFEKSIVCPPFWCLFIGACWGFATVVHAAGTPAGASVVNQANFVYRVGGAATPRSQQVQVRTYVDELLEVSVVSDDGSPVPVSTPQTSAVLQFSITNLGNGRESFRLVADATLVGDDFDALNPVIVLESNGIPGYQTGAGGDTPYIEGNNDPDLAADAVLVAYVALEVPAGLTGNDVSRVELRAVANTIVSNAGTDDPAATNFPPVATSYDGAGDVLDGPAVTAVVGASYDQTNLLLRDQGSLQISNAILQMNKTVVSVLDPTGGSTVVPGSIITYEISVAVTGTADAQNVVVTDPLPADLEYQAGTIVVSGLPPGQEADDDFEPTGVDDTGFDPQSAIVQAVIGTVTGASPVTVRFQAAVR